nr:unnamed protein product [Callosobruchus analis]
MMVIDGAPFKPIFSLLYRITFPYSLENCLNVTGGVMFEGALLAGFARLPCGQNRTRFRHWYVPVTNFVNRLLKAYPYVRLKLGSEEFEANYLPETTLRSHLGKNDTPSGTPTTPKSLPTVTNPEEGQVTGVTDEIGNNVTSDADA